MPQELNRRAFLSVSSIFRKSDEEIEQNRRNKNLLRKRKVALFVHGFRGRRNSWGKIVRELRFSEKFNENFVVEYFEYKISFLKVLVCRIPKIGMYLARAPGIDAFAAALRTKIEHLNAGKIYIVAHSMGGLIVKEFVCISERIHRDKNTKNKRVKAIVLIATPNLGTEIAKFGLIFYYNSWCLKQALRGSGFLAKMEKDWRESKISEKYKIRYIAALNDSIVDYDSATNSWGSDCVDAIPNVGHSAILNPKKSNGQIIQILKRHLGVS